MFERDDRVVVISEEPDPSLVKKGAAIPVGTTGTVLYRSGNDTNPATGESEDFYTVVFDIPYEGNTNHINYCGLSQFDVFESMIELLGDVSPIDIDGIFD